MLPNGQSLSFPKIGLKENSFNSICANWLNIH